MDPADVVPVAEAIAAFPQLRELQALADDGWVFANRKTADGVVFQIDGFYCWPRDVTDAFSVRSETDAFGLRTLEDEGGIVWEKTGGFTEVVRELRLLPPPDDPKAPRLVKGSGRGLWTPNQRS